MKTNFKLFMTVLLCIGFQTMLNAQRDFKLPKYKVSDGTKVVMVVNSQSGQMEDLVMFSKLKKGEDAPGKSYYTGVLYGEFKENPPKKSISKTSKKRRERTEPKVRQR